MNEKGSIYYEVMLGDGEWKHFFNNPLDDKEALQKAVELSIEKNPTPVYLVCWRYFMSDDGMFKYKPSVKEYTREFVNGNENNNNQCTSLPLNSPLTAL